MSLAFSVLPLIFVIAAGYGLGKSGLIPRENWGGIEALSFRALIPAMLVLAIAQTDLSVARYGGFAVVLLGVLACLGGLALVVWRLTGMSRASAGSVFQLSVRWNAFVALAAADVFLADGIAVLAIAIALLIPTINVACIVVLAALGPAQAGPGQIARTVSRNPLVIACAIGLALNLSGVTLPESVASALDMIARGALAVGLMAIGAGISLRRLATLDARVGVSVLLRPVIGPVLFAGLGTLWGLPAMQLFAGVLVFAAPAASNGYIIAKQMGADAELYADVMTWQVVLSMLCLPIWAALLL
ncbi:AEC family transporter [Sulfitobacter albidus]|uniref:AEC family transporter n=1 Tax=Sulfitobacter albidus TaxID=2829501 RepID=A0A975PMF2_9RHOB|nr:AEC family transporter [Sulfitobacter albidus]QUJ76356.1 AEC family transporter [Sulfitobacter albidus]